MVCTWGSSYSSLYFCRCFNFSIIKRKKKKCPQTRKHPSVWTTPHLEKLLSKLGNVNSGGPIPGPGEVHQVGSLVCSLPLHQTKEKDMIFPCDPALFTWVTWTQNCSHGVFIKICLSMLVQSKVFWKIIVDRMMSVIFFLFQIIFLKYIFIVESTT